MRMFNLRLIAAACFILCALGLISAPSAATESSPELLFEAGTRAYMNGDWNGAMKHWKAVEDAGFHSSELYYNLGNAFFKLGRLGYAILYWERTAEMTGETGDVAANLSIARARLKDKQPELVRLAVWDWLDQIRAMAGERTLFWGGIIGSFGLFGIIALRHWVFRSMAARRSLGVMAYLMAAVLTLSLVFTYLEAHQRRISRSGVIVAAEVPVLSAPADGAGKLLFLIHEGTKVRIHRTLEDWFEVSLDKEKQGWIKREFLEII